MPDSVPATSAVTTPATAQDPAQAESVRGAPGPAPAPDPLTGLPGREALLAWTDQAIAAARRRKDMLALLAFDLDEFIQVNERFGAAGGDRLLVEIVHRAQSVLRDSDALGRVGGDDFLVAVARIGSLEQAEAVARRVVARLGEPFLLDGQWMSPSVSLGVAVYPDHGLTAAVLAAKADAALARAKRGGKGRAAFAAGGLA